MVDGTGFVSINPGTMQHTEYQNIFSLGDCSNAPISKTAAAVFSQAPVVVNNLVQLHQGNELNANYEGYTSCPLYTGDGKLMLMEFKYGNIPEESFYNNQE